MALSSGGADVWNGEIRELLPRKRATGWYGDSAMRTGTSHRRQPDRRIPDNARLRTGHAAPGRGAIVNIASINASAVLFLASPLAEFTGQVLVVDGGQLV